MPSNSGGKTPDPPQVASNVQPLSKLHSRLWSRWGPKAMNSSTVPRVTRYLTAKTIFQRLPHYLTLSICLSSPKASEEAAFANQLKPTYRYQSAAIGLICCLYTAVTLGIMIPSLYNHEGMTQIMTWSIVCGFGELFAVFLFFSYRWRIGQSSGEIICYLCLVFLPVATSIWPYVTPYKEHHLATNHDDLIRCLWIAQWSSTVLALIVINCWMSSRTRLSVYVHLLLLVCYVTNRISWLVVRGWTRLGGRILSLSTLIVQVAGVTYVAVMLYISRYKNELQQRVSCLENRFERRQIDQIRRQDRARRKSYAKELSQIERVLVALKTASLEVLNLAYKFSESGDFYYIEIYEQISSCISLIRNHASSLFALADDPNDQQTSDARKTRNTNVGDDLIECPFSHPLLNFPSEDLQIVPDVQIGKDLEVGFMRLYTMRPNLLVEVGVSLLQGHPVLGNLATGALVRYLYILQSFYPKNPYHNHGHAAMVTHFSNVLTQVFDVTQDGEMGFAMLLAALGHDVGHPGRNTQFIMNDGYAGGCPYLFALLGPTNMLEKLHSHLVFRLAQCDGCNIFKGMDEQTYRRIRNLVNQLIIGTDMADHYELIGQLRVRIENSGAANKAENTDGLLLRKMLLKLADVSHVFVAWHEHFEWSLRITNEFYQQGDLEQSLRYVVSPLCDRSEESSWSTSQQGFISFVVSPLVTELGRLPHNTSFGYITKQMENNLNRWKTPKRYENGSDETTQYGHEEQLLKCSMTNPTELFKFPFPELFTANTEPSEEYIEESSTPINQSVSDDHDGADEVDEEEYEIDPRFSHSGSSSINRSDSANGSNV